MEMDAGFSKKKAFYLAKLLCSSFKLQVTIAIRKPQGTPASLKAELWKCQPKQDN